MFDAILRKICIINLEFFFDQYNIWTNVSLIPEFHVADLNRLPVMAIWKFGVFKVWKIWKTPKIGDFRCDFTENLHIKSSKKISPFKLWRIFLPESEISCTSYERFGFYSPNKIVTFCVSEFIFFEKGENSAIFNAISRKIGI